MGLDCLVPTTCIGAEGEKREILKTVEKATRLLAGRLVWAATSVNTQVNENKSFTSFQRMGLLRCICEACEALKTVQGGPYVSQPMCQVLPLAIATPIYAALLHSVSVSHSSPPLPSIHIIYLADRPSRSVFHAGWCLVVLNADNCVVRVATETCGFKHHIQRPGRASIEIGVRAAMHKQDHDTANVGALDGQCCTPQCAILWKVLKPQRLGVRRGD